MVEVSEGRCEGQAPGAGWSESEVRVEVQALVRSGSGLGFSWSQGRVEGAGQCEGQDGLQVGVRLEGLSWPDAGLGPGSGV